MGVELDLQQAIIARLRSEAANGTRTASGVYDQRRQEYLPLDLPYIIVSEAVLTNTAVDEMDTFNALIRVHTWTRKKNALEVMQMQGDVYAALHNRELLLPVFGSPDDTNWICYSLLRETSMRVPDPDGAFHGVCEYRALIYSAP